MQNEPILDSLRRVLMKISPTLDLQLIILKGHLLIEEQLRAIVEKKIPGHSALGMDDGTKWTFDHKARLAKALCHGEKHESLWKGVRKLNRLRNVLAHNVELAGLSDMVDDLNRSQPGAARSDQKLYLRITLCSMFIALHNLAEPPGDENGG